MKYIIVGLGNPGKAYEHTRHNAGFMAADELGRRLGIEIRHEKYHSWIGKGRIDSCETVLAKPQTYMNESGRAIAAILRDSYLAPSDLIVIHDELDLSLGSVRIKIGGGHGGHNGLRSIIEYLGTPDFTRIRIGIGRPVPGMDAADYVLSAFTKDERVAARQAVEQAAQAVKEIVSQGLTRAMNLFNQK